MPITDAFVYNLGVDHRRSHAAVSKQPLNFFHWHTASERLSGCCVSKYVRRNAPVTHPCARCNPLDDALYVICILLFKQSL